MTIDQKVAIRGVLILADARFDNRRVGKRRNVIAEISPQALDCAGINYPAAGIGIQNSTMAIEGYLEAAIFNVRQRIRNARTGVVQPNWHLWRSKQIATWRRTEEEDLLTR